MSVQFRINAIGQNLSAGEFDMRGSVNENTEPYDNREEGFKVTSLVTDIVLEVCWAPPDSPDLRHFSGTVTSSGCGS